MHGSRTWILVALLAALVAVWPAASAAASTPSLDGMQAELQGEFHSQVESMTKTMESTGGVVAPSAAPSDPVPATSPPPAPAPPAPAPPPQVDAAPTGGVTSPAAGHDGGQSNTNVSIRVLSPGNDGGVVQQNSASGGGAADAAPQIDTSPIPADIPSVDDLTKAQTWTVKGIEVTLKIQELPPSIRDIQRTLPRAFAPPGEPPSERKPAAPSARHRHRTHAAIPSAPTARPALEPVLAMPAASNGAAGRREAPPPAAKPRHGDRGGGGHRPVNPFPLSHLPLDQTVGAGSAGGTSTPPPAPMAVLLAAACFAASMLVTALWGAHRRHRSRLFASRLERPG